MLININEIKIGANRREALPEDVKALAESIAEIGMMNPITVDLGNNLVTGLHRLEAAKLLGWTEIECNVRELDELHAELAEIDENVIRAGLSDLELAELLARRKKIYEALHPETKHGGDRKSKGIKSSNCRDDSAKSFAQDTAEKMGVSPRTVERSVQIAENLTPETKEILRNAERKISKQNMRKLAAMMRPEQQAEAAGQLASGEIKSVDEYYRAHGMMTFEDGVAALKDLNRDRSYTPELFVEETVSNFHTVQKELDWLGMPYFQALYASVSQEQLDQLKSSVNTIHAILDNFINAVETAMRGNAEEIEKQETAEIPADEKEAS